MLCQQCQKKAANVHFMQIINGKKVELYLCEQCANEKGQLGFNPQLNLSAFLWGFPGFGSESLQQEEPEEARCTVCGMSFEDFTKTGKLGCGNCYSVFRDSLGPILKRFHGNMEHTGKVPGRLSGCIQTTNELEKLRNELAEAIGREEYEKAAGLRDRIRSLENSAKQCGGV